jgi:hypothetical protein
MSGQNTLLKFTNLISDSFLELKKALAEDSDFLYLLKQLGWDLNIPASDLASVITQIEALYSFMSTLDPDDVDIDDILELVSLIKNITQTIDNLSNFSISVPSEFLPDLKKALPEFLLIEVMRKKYPRIYQVLTTLEIIKFEKIPAATPKIAYTKVSIDTSKLKQIISEPDKLIKAALQWVNTGGLLTMKVIYRLYRLLNGLGLSASFNPSDDMSGTITNSINLHLFSFAVGGEIETVGIDFTGYSQGIMVKPTLPEEVSATISLGESMEATIYGGTDFLQDFSAYFGIDAIRFMHPNFDLAENTENYIKAGINLKIANKDGTPKLIINGGAVSLGYKVLTLMLEAIYKENKVDLRTGVKFDDLELKLSAKDTDSFLGKILGDDEKSLMFQMELQWSSLTGFHFTGSGGFELAVPTAIEIGKIKFENIVLSLKLPSGEDNKLFSFEASSDFKLETTSVQLSIFQFGLGLYLSQNPNSSGKFDFDIGVKFPTGVAFGIETSSVKGGGFLKIEKENNRYLGGLELKINKITLAVIGILKTKLPGGKDGYSLLLLVTVDGFKPVPLGFGFTLNGVGGLLGLHRTANLEALRNGLRTGANQSILFPKDIAKNADKIISDLETCFPDKEGRFLIGPMVKIGYGAPKTLITVDLGIIIDIPAPIKIAILGVVQAILPDEDNAKLVIKINFLGTIDFEKKMITFDASIYESKILTMEISGDMAFRLKWGDQSNFLLSVGGFHPKFIPPPLDLPVMRRLAISLINKDFLKVGLETYFAVTSNTVQLGAKVSAFYEHGKYNALGMLWLDVLFQFSPFYFIADMGAMVVIRRKTEELLSALLQLTLQGPTPWNVSGTAAFKFLKMGFTLHFDETFGESDAQTLEDKDVWPELMAAMKHKDNWITILPERNQLFVSIKPATATPEELFLHPLGKLALNQTLSPFNFTLQKFGNVKPKDFKKFRIDTVKDESNNALSYNVLNDKFAPAQFLQLTDDQKLSRPSFEDLQSGISLGTDNLVTAHKINKQLDYQTPKIFDRRMRKRNFEAVATETLDFANRAMANNTVNRSNTNVANTAAYSHDAPGTMASRQREYAVAYKANMHEFSSERFTAYAHADAYLNQQVNNNLTYKGKLIVADDYELVF